MHTSQDRLQVPDREREGLRDGLLPAELPEVQGTQVMTTSEYVLVIAGCFAPVWLAIGIVVGALITRRKHDR